MPLAGRRTNPIKEKTTRDRQPTLRNVDGKRLAAIGCGPPNRLRHLGTCMNQELPAHHKPNASDSIGNGERNAQRGTECRTAACLTVSSCVIRFTSTRYGVLPSAVKSVANRWYFRGERPSRAMFPGSSASSSGAGKLEGSKPRTAARFWQTVFSTVEMAESSACPSFGKNLCRYPKRSKRRTACSLRIHSGCLASVS